MTTEQRQKDIGEITIPSNGLKRFFNSLPVISNPHVPHEIIGSVDLTFRSGHKISDCYLIGRSPAGTEFYCTDKEINHDDKNMGVGLRLYSSTQSIRELTIVVDPGYAKRHGN